MASVVPLCSTLMAQWVEDIEPLSNLLETFTNNSVTQQWHMKPSDAAQL